MSSEPERAVAFVLSKRVADYMEENVLMLHEDVQISVASQIMYKRQEDNIIVADENGNPVGIVTDEDILHKIGEFHVDPNTTSIKEIMSSPLISIGPDFTLKEALAKMRDFSVRKLVVISKNSSVLGIIFQRTIADELKKSTMISPKLLTTPIRSILGNLGFVLQFSGILLIIPAVLGTLLGEYVTAASIFLTSVLLLGTGFFLNSYGEKAKLNLRQASILVFLSWFFLILYGTVPHIYSTDFSGMSHVELFADSFFASAAGFTTAGISFIDKPETLPQSFTFYRSFTQFIGGMSFIYLVMTAFYPEAKLRSMRGFISGRTLHLKELFGTITIIFSIYVAIIAALLYFFGERNIIDNVSLAMSAVSTGGFVPNSTLLPNMVLEEYVIIMAAMILGALPFTFHYVFIRKRFVPPKLGTEILVYFGILAVGIVLFTLLGGFDWWTGAFGAIAASTTAGFQINDTVEAGSAARVVLMILMFIGGCGFSTAGGIKVYRLINLRNVRKLISKATRDLVSKDDRKEIATTSILLCLFPLFTLLVAVHFTSYGFGFEESFFEASGVITNGGLTLGIVNADMEPITKIMLVFVMILGRLEVIAMVYIIAPKLAS
jgi:trk system potassium uptake protein